MGDTMKEDQDDTHEPPEPLPHFLQSNPTYLFGWAVGALDWRGVNIALSCASSILQGAPSASIAVPADQRTPLTINCRIPGRAQAEWASSPV